MGTGAAKLVKQDILNAFIPALCSPCLARSCCLFSVSFVTALGPSKQELSKYVAGAKTALGILTMSLGMGLLCSAGTVTQLLYTLALGIPNTFSGDTEPGVWLRRGRGQSPDCHLGEQECSQPGLDTLSTALLPLRVSCSFLTPFTPQREDKGP